MIISSAFCFGFVVFLCFIFLIYMYYRNEYILKYRINILLDEQYHLKETFIYYNKLPSYNRMLWQIFKWDWQDYLNK